MTYRNNSKGARESERPSGAQEPTLSTDVRVWKINQVRSKRAPYQLRWIVAGKVKTASFATITLADSRRSDLWKAMVKGEAFDIESGLPESELRAAAARENVRPDPSWWDFSREYMASRWRTSAAKTREGLADSLATVALAMMGDGKKAPSPEAARLAVRWAVVPAHKDDDPPADLTAACTWLQNRSLSLSALTDPKVLRDVQYRLSFKLDNTPAAGRPTSAVVAASTPPWSTRSSAATWKRTRWRA